jgi:autotransporter-associated beta strand protein
MKSLTAAKLALAIATLLASRARAANLITNSSFEGATTIDPTTGDILPVGWILGPPSPATLSKVNIDTAINLSTDLAPEDGSQYARFQSPANNGTRDCLYQYITTTPGTLYNISFWVTLTSTSVGNVSGLDPIWDETGSPINLGTNQFYYSPTNTSPIPYEYFSFTEPATLSTTRIDFHGIDANGSVLLDNINVSPVASAPANLNWSNKSGNNLWDTTSANWTVAGTLFHNGDITNFVDKNGGTSSYSVTLNTSVTSAAVLVNNNAGDYSFSGTGSISGSSSLTKMGTATLTLSLTNNYSGHTDINGGKLIIGVQGALSNAPVSIGPAGALQLASNIHTATIPSLSIATGGVFDITNNTLAINFAAPANDPVAIIKNYLTTGYNAGLWTGAGLNSSTAAAGSSGETLAIGFADGNTDPGTPAAPNQILIKYTLAGDTNLDGLVNFADLVAVVQNFNKSGTDWSTGNFAYGASTSFADLVAVVQNFNKILTPAGSASNQPGTSTLSIAPTAVRVPEPAAFALLSLAAITWVTRRPRK